MATAAKLASGTSLARNGNTIAELTNIGGIEISLDAIDVTSHQSADSFKEYVGGLLDVGEVSIEGNFIPGDTNGQVGLLTDMLAKTLQSFVIAFPAATGTTWSFSALVTKFKAADAPVDGVLPFSASLKISGKPTLATAASNNLSNLVLTTATLYPAFAAGTYDYTATSIGASITVTPTAAAGTITVNGNVVATGVPSGAISLGAIGAVTTVTVVVTETNKSAKTYVVRVAKTA